MKLALQIAGALFLWTFIARLLYPPIWSYAKKKFNIPERDDFGVITYVAFWPITFTLSLPIIIIAILPFIAANKALEKLELEKASRAERKKEQKKTKQEVLEEEVMAALGLEPELIHSPVYWDVRSARLAYENDEITAQKYVDVRRQLRLGLKVERTRSTP